MIFCDLPHDEACDYSQSHIVHIKYIGILDQLMSRIKGIYQATEMLWYMMRSGLAFLCSQVSITVTK
jgi:hypothetical protein